jgi:hypothetical protein
VKPFPPRPAGRGHVDGILQKDHRVVVGVGDRAAAALGRRFSDGLGARHIVQAVEFAGLGDVPVLAELAGEVAARRAEGEHRGTGQEEHDLVARAGANEAEPALALAQAAEARAEVALEAAVVEPVPVATAHAFDGFDFGHSPHMGMRVSEGKSPMGPMRTPAVAGSFYPERPGELAAAVQAYLAAVSADASADAAPVPKVIPKAIIVPHAGFIYSGAVAAAAYARLTPLAGTVERVVLLGPSHTVALGAVAAPHAEAFDGPLGPLTVDREALWSLAGLSQVVQDDAPHAREHALEVQLPFLQTVLS